MRRPATLSIFMFAAACSSSSTAPRQESAPAEGSVRSPDSARLEVTPEQAHAAGLPALRVRVDTAGGPMLASATPEPGRYVGVSGPPGGVLQLDVWTTHERQPGTAAVERAIRARFNQPFHDPLVISSPARIELAGGTRDAVALFTGKDFTRTAWCAAIVPAGSASALVTFGRSAGTAPAVTCQKLLEDATLGKVVRSLRITAE
jgi:hypothetical protein